MSMTTTPIQLRPAQTEVRRAAHNQDLREVQRQARFEREAEGVELKSIPAKEVAL
jgi:hypothetical protein